MSQEMSESTPPTSPETSPGRATAAPARTPQFRITALVVIVVVLGVVLWLVFRHSGSSQKTQLPATAATQSQLATLAATLRHPIFWAGPRSGYTYELTQSSTGAIYIRYLPAGVAVGSSKPYLTIATYPYPGAYPALQAVAKQNGETAINAPKRGLAVVASSSPGDVHLAYPGVDYQIEVFDPSNTATTLVAGGKIEAFGKLRAGSSQASPPRALTTAGIAALAKSLKHPLYWVGPKHGYTYEVTQTSTGQVFIRYLPPGVKVGASQGYLTVGTYPYNGAYDAIKGLAGQGGNTQTQLRHGGIAVGSSSDPNSIHLAFRGSNFEVEVFSPSPPEARRLVSSNKVAPIG